MFDPIDLIAPVLSHFSLVLIVSMLSILKHLNRFCISCLISPVLEHVSTRLSPLQLRLFMYSTARTRALSASSSSSLIVGDSCSCSSSCCMVIGLLDGKRI
eukprot:240353_1